MAEYIEREKVIKLLNDNIGNTAAEAAANGHFDEYFDGWTDATSSAIMGAESIPAADVRPERHGVWGRVSDDDQYEGWYFCSECKDEYFTPAEDDENMLPNFCPNCGAKMDGKDGESDA